MKTKKTFVFLFVLPILFVSILLAGSQTKAAVATSTLSIFPQSLSLVAGDKATVSITGSGGYYIFGNSKSNLASASISGSNIIINGLSGCSIYSTGCGLDTITVCQSDGQCANLYVEMSNNNTPVTFTSITSSTLSLIAGNSATVSLAGYGGYYISSNSYPNVASASISGSAINVSGLRTGSTIISVCQSYGVCGNLYINISTNKSPITLSPSSLTLTVGNNGSVFINTNGSSDLYIESILNRNATTSISGYNMIVSGLSVGSDSITVCHEGSCGYLNVNVVAANNTPTANIPPLSFNENGLTLFVGNSANVSVTGNGGYYISNNSNNNTNTGATTASISGSTITVKALNAGNSTITVCQSGGQCGNLYVNVVAANNTIAATNPIVSAYTPVAGDLVKSNGLGSKEGEVYYIGSDLKAYLFATRGTYGSWYPDFSNLKKISQTDFAKIVMGGNVTARAGANLVKFANSNTYYAVAPGAKLCALNNATAATTLYGASYATRITDYVIGGLPSLLLSNYTVDSSCALNNSSNLPNGTVFQYAGSAQTYYVQDGKKRAISTDAFNANMLRDNMIIRNVSTAMTFTDGPALTTKEDAIANLH